MDKHITLVLITVIAIASSLLGNFAQANDVLTELKNYTNTHTAEQSIAHLNQFDLDNSDFSAEEKAKFYFQYGQLFEQTRQLDLSIASYDKGISYVEALPVTDILIDSYLERSFANYLKTNDPAVYCIDRVKALNYARQHSNLELLTKTLTQNAFCYENANNFHIGIALLDEALEIVDKSEHLNANRKAMIYNATGSLYRNIGMHQQGYDHFEKAFQTWQTIDDKQDMFNMLHNMFSQSIKLGNWVQAQANVEQQFQLADNAPQLKDLYFFANLNAGRLGLRTYDFQQAIFHLSKAIELKHTTQEHYFVSSSYLFLALAYMRNGQAVQAVEMAHVFKQNESFRVDKSDMILKADAIIAFGNKDYLTATNLLFKLIDDEREKNQAMLNNEVINSALKHQNNVTEFEKELLVNKLAINELQLAALKDKEHIKDLTLMLIALLTSTLAILLIFSLNTYKKRSQTDYLTKIANRGYTYIKGEQLIKRCIKLNKPASVIIFDIDNFKEINDKYGHHIGDLAIKSLANRAKSSIKKQDLVGRIGGEEFLIVLPNTSEQEAVAISERLRHSIAEKTFSFGDIEINFTISLGVSEIEPSSSALQDLVMQADKALYQAKFFGKNKVYIARQCA
ncbi:MULTISPECIES: GGDEF domain-containing protein [Pseudomonadati]|uniref:diguanylate cyclase n=1 Tax=Shewanella aestuarii TaxID=1028752 RepID=A0ABT0KWQ5_9GAMM|nr:GGDEF domain-containing protein [Shewanella aestuarii]MCL1115700.1 GGDEF domain-containing protein [Shewanella aestuarii]GGN68356.1 GGDEF domain-containing protein [Shewanella aestuarii]